MIHPGFAIYSAIGLLGGPLWFYHGFRSFHRKRLIENTPTARIRSMAMGLVEVNGLVTSRSQVVAPFSGRACAYWQVDVSTHTGKRRWHVVHRNQSGSPFFLKDDTGVALVYPHGAECRVQFGVEEECTGLMLPDCYDQYLKEQVGAKSMMWRVGRLRFRERILQDGERAYILGTAMPRSKAVMLSDEATALATGTDGNLWTQTQQMLDQNVAATIRQGQNEPTFLISQSSERELTLMLALKAFAGMIGGPIAALFGLMYWLDALSRFRPGH